MDNLSFDLPGISPVGLDLITLLNASQATVKQIAAQARLDPVIFGNIIACANSPMYQEANKSADILTSLVRLGQREIKRIVYQVVLRSAFFHESVEINAILDRVWRQSLTANLFMQKFVSAVPEVRERVTAWLRDMRRLGDLIVEGRDIGSVVFPDSPWRFDLDADPEERARRRLVEDVAKGFADQGAKEQVKASLLNRDKIDSSRKTAPLVVPPGATRIDTTAMTIADVVDFIVSAVQP